MTKRPKKKKVSKRDADLEEFRAQTRDAFAFLVNDFGFQEEPIPFAENKYLNEFAVWYASSTTRIVVEGINWGMSTRVALGNVGLARQFENHDFLHVLAIRDAEAGGSERKVSGNQLEQLTQYATLLREVAVDVLRGDHSIFPEIAACIERRVAERRRQLQPPSLDELAEAYRIVGIAYQLEGDTKAARKYYELALSNFLEVQQRITTVFKMKDTSEIDDLEAKIDQLRDLISKLEK